MSVGRIAKISRLLDGRPLSAVVVRDTVFELDEAAIGDARRGRSRRP
jgi:hypothetical protein